MALHLHLTVIGLAASLLAGTAAAQTAPTPPAAPAAPDTPATAPAGERLRSNEALLMLDYQVIKVPGDAPIDLMGFHVHSKVREGVYLGAGVYAPHLGALAQHFERRPGQCQRAPFVVLRAIQGRALAL